MASPTPPGAQTYFERARRGLTAWWRYPAAGVLAVALWVALIVVLTFGAARVGWLSRDLTSQLMSPTHPVTFFLGAGATFGTLLLAFAVAVRLLQKKRFGDVAGAWRWRLFALGAGAWAAVSIVSSLVDDLAAPHAFAVTASAATGPLALAAVAGLGVQTVAEEWLFRGWITQGLLLATRRPLASSIISGLLFGALHIPNGWPQAANALVFGIVTALIAIRTGGIAFTLGVHLVNNLFGAIVVVSAGDVFKGAAGLLTERAVAGLQWVDVALAAAGLAAVTLLAWRVSAPPQPAP